MLKYLCCYVDRLTIEDIKRLVSQVLDAIFLPKMFGIWGAQSVLCILDLTYPYQVRPLVGILPLIQYLVWNLAMKLMDMDIQGTQRIIHEAHFHSAQSYNQRDLARQYYCRYTWLFLITYYLNTDTAHTKDIGFNFKSIIPSHVCHWLFKINFYFLLNN